jgi:glycerol-3-phosphate dehydrogenase
MKREAMLQQLESMQIAFDFVIIGGGATGVGILLEAVSRGYSAALFEKHDFTKSTSSKSTKLVHGGVRYLAQGDVALVREACIERGRLAKNAPHLVTNQSFIIPAYGIWDQFMYTAGLKLYDLMAGSYSLGRSVPISKPKVLKRMPGLLESKLSGGIVYHDGQFDDSRLALNVLQTAVSLSGIAINYMPVEKLLKDEKGKICGLEAKDEESGKIYRVKAKNVINATGVFADDIMHLDNPALKKSIRPSQGIHVVLDKSFLPGEDALMIPKTDDGRVLFAVPWHDKIVLGTTDTPIDYTSVEPVALEEEIRFILSTAGRYLKKAPARSDVLSVFAGLRPLAAPKEGSKKTREISRSHKIISSPSGLLTMIGGKWTTFRKMAEDMIDKAEKINNWNQTDSPTKTLKLHAYMDEACPGDPLGYYGSDALKIRILTEDSESSATRISEKLPVIKAQVIFAVKEEMARTVEDFLSRRTRCLLLDARESVKMAPLVAGIMASELGKSKDWEKEQIESYQSLAKNYILD